MASFSYQYQYSLNCDWEFITTYFTCNRNNWICWNSNSTATWITSSNYIFSNSPLTSSSINNSPSCSNLTLVSSSVIIDCVTDRGSNYYWDCSIVSWWWWTTPEPDNPDIPDNPIIPPSSFNWNLIQSIDGAVVTLDDEALATWVWQPMFFWYWQLLNVAITFVPVIVVVSCFWLIYWWLKNLWNKNTLESKKSLDNK